MHLITDTVLALQEQVKSAADLNPTFMPTEEKASALLALVQVEAQLTELRLRLMAASSDVADTDGFRSIATWLAHHAHLRRSDTVADLYLAQTLDRNRPALAAALREGHANTEQARVIARALDPLPAHLGQDLVERAETELLRLAAHHDPKELTVLGRRILEILDPQRFDDEEARKLADAEKHAQEKQRLHIRAVGDGTTRITALVPDAVAARLSTYLHAFTNPRLSDGQARENAAHQTEAEQTAFGPVLNHPRRLAEAFGQLLETLDPTRLPIHGGDATHVTVTIPLTTLLQGIGTATIDNEVPGDGHTTITPAQARRLACTAQVIPAVLGTDSEVLDLGRASRLFTKAQRRALLLRDHTCRAEGCTIPGTWTEAHHLHPWSHGGTTDLSNALLLCSRHHHRAHDPTRHVERLPNGDVRFTRRC